jgi:hypothetical protein
MAVDVARFLKLVDPAELLPRRTGKAQRVSTKLVEKFFPPIPQAWAVKASKAGGRYRSQSALLVGLLIWQEYRFNNGAGGRIRMTKAKLRAVGIGRYSAQSGLIALEKAGLITVERFKHRSPLITIVNGKAGVTLTNP